MTAQLPSGFVPAGLDAPMPFRALPDRRIARAVVTVVVTVVLAAAIVIDLSQILVAANGNISAIRLTVTAALAIGWGLPVAQRRMRGVPFTLLAAGAAMIVITAGLFALTAHPPA
ncbi:MAG: hypothetical protein JWL73_1496 [Actinomycetia bacterium]|nr:hypothetical protein [Actinomycetes bacterium]